MTLTLQRVLRLESHDSSLSGAVLLYQPLGSPVWTQHERLGRGPRLVNLAKSRGAQSDLSGHWCRTVTSQKRSPGENSSSSGPKLPRTLLYMPWTYVERTGRGVSSDVPPLYPWVLSRLPSVPGPHTTSNDKTERS